MRTQNYGVRRNQKPSPLTPASQGGNVNSVLSCTFCEQLRADGTKEDISLQMTAACYANPMLQDLQSSLVPSTHIFFQMPHIWKKTKLRSSQLIKEHLTKSSILAAEIFLTPMWLTFASSVADTPWKGTCRILMPVFCLSPLCIFMGFPFL